MKLRAVMDTNVLVSGVLWRGVPFELLRWAEKNSLVIYTRLEILAEVPPPPVRHVLFSLQGDGRLV